MCEVNASEVVALSFAMRYVNLFNKAGPLAEKVSLRLSNEYPMTISY